MSFSIGLQLYSIRNEFEKDYKGTLIRVKELGFDGVEFAGFYDIPAQALKSVIDEVGLKAAGSHTSYDLLLHNLDEVMEYNRIIHNKNIVCPMCFFEDMEEYQSVIHNLKMIGTRLKEEGFHFSYHNHNHEFAKFEEKYILDKIFEDCKVIVPELDVYWIYRGLEKETSYLEKYLASDLGEQMVLVHLKDGTMEGGTALFEGKVDIAGVLKLLVSSKIQWVIVEDETPYPDSFDSVATSIANLKQYMDQHI